MTQLRAMQLLAQRRCTPTSLVESRLSTVERSVRCGHGAFCICKTPIGISECLLLCIEFRPPCIQLLGEL